MTFFFPNAAFLEAAMSLFEGKGGGGGGGGGQVEERGGGEGRQGEGREVEEEQRGPSTGLRDYRPLLLICHPRGERG